MRYVERQISVDQKCHYCKRTLLIYKTGMPPEQRECSASVDHKIPKNLGGQNTHENYVISCARCNQLKGSLPYVVFKTFSNMVLVLHPNLPLPIIRNSLNLYTMHLLDMACNNAKAMRDASTMALLRLKEDMDVFENNTKRRRKR